MHIAYITNARMPTEKAHGYQIAKMCEAFADLGATVTLTLPKRINPITESIQNYYGVKTNFEVCFLPFLDFLAISWLPDRIGFYLNSLEYALRLIWLKPQSDTVVYTRIAEIAWLYSKRGFKTFFECHSLPPASRLFRYLINHATGIIAITQGLKDDLIQNYGQKPEKIIVSPDGVDLATFDINIDRHEARRKLNLPQDKSIVVYTGHLYAWKGVDTLAQAAALLPQGILVYMIGGTELEIKELKGRQQITDNVVLLTPRPRDEIAIWLKAADLLALPNSAKEKISEKYTSPLKLFEYMASGTPIVASDLPSIKEILDESLAFLCPPDEPHGLADAINKSLKDKTTAESHAHKAQQAIHTYTWLSRAEKILSSL
jgi:glycosyltransferase involved in cell wall biosynthesis